MAPWTWALIAIIVVAVVAGAALLARRRRTTSLQERFGPEYDRTVESAEDRGAAEAQLQDRAKRRSQLKIVPLTEPTRLGYADQWRDLQEQFVDRPSETVSGAEILVTQVLGERGYPVSEFDDQAGLVSVDYPDVVENYRIAHRIHQRNQAQQASTEDLREALLRYRSLFDGLLRSDERPDELPAPAANGTRAATTNGAANITQEKP